MRASPRVTIIQRRLVQYRVTLFERLRRALAERGIELRVVYGPPSPTDAVRNDSGTLAWGDEVHSRWFTVGGHELVWHPGGRAVADCDLLVLTQENKILSNYPALAQRSLRSRRLAYWGHGVNLQSTNPDGLSERFKKVLVNQVDWWFAYTDHTRDILTAGGFDPARITVLDNAIDNEAFEADLAAVDDDHLARLRAEIDLAPGAPLGLYCGSLYVDKRVDLLAEVGDRLVATDPSFRLVVIGDGPARADLEALAAERPWMRCVGVRRGREKAAWFRLATVQLSPGAVGLHVLDSFAAGVPLVTTRDAAHGPEIAYLDHGVNGFVVDDDPTALADEVRALLADPGRHAEVVAAGRTAAARYTLPNMVDRFVGGIVAALD